MSKTYGVSYMGSKSRIAEKIISYIPKAKHFYDLFAGGCAITHAALLSGRWKQIHANDIQGMGLRLFCAATEGAYRNERRWISRETFEELKTTDPYISLCWSFGNNQDSYMYAKELEPWKRALHYARVFNDYSAFRQFGIETDGSRADIARSQNECYREAVRSTE